MINNFDVNTVTLSGKNLVEASAGTGKTYSIGILAIRLIVEKNISVDKILMVTFTNAAVAELEARIRKFIRIAYKIAKGKEVSSEYDGIEKLLTVIKTDKKATESEIINRLDAAIKLLDETSIQTIHSFCQTTLSEYAFETNQIYGAELLTDIDDIIRDAVQDFWREEITILDINILKEININLHNLINVVKESLSEKIFIGSSRHFSSITNYISDKITLRKELIIYLKTLEPQIQEAVKRKIPRYTQNTADNTWMPLLDVPEKFYQKLKNGTHNAANVFNIDEVTSEGDEYINITRNTINGIYKEVISQVKQKTKKYLFKNKLMTHDDLITNVYKAVVQSKNKTLITALQTKYEAVFIDEFQDTDKNQYEIFNTLFGDKNTLFYIGDPKQSIYGWRKADINTYFAAKNNCEAHIMSKNFRSSKNYVAAMNVFFNSIPDPFSFSNEVNNRIDYETITVNKNESELKMNGNKLKPITIYDEAGEIPKNTAINILKLLNEGELNGKKVVQNNIAVLVRTGREGKIIKNELEKLGIPAITMDDSKVFRSEAAKDISYILETVIDLSWKGINKALLNEFTGKTSQDLLLLNKKNEVDRFRKYQEIWTEKGIYSMLQQYLIDYNVQQYLFEGVEVEGGDRIISNYNQLAEILQKQESQNKYAKTELYRFLKRNIEGFDEQNDEYIQRIETDDDAVKIITIHKSKGLEYDIVFAPHLDVQVKERGNFTSFRRYDEYVFTPKNQLGENENVWRIQQEQENRRLLYVAITRAKYNCFIFKKKETKTATTLTPFYEALQVTTSQALIEIKPFDLQLENDEKFKVVNLKTKRKPIEIPKLNLSDKHWRKMSYSYLSGDHKYTKKEIKKDAYEQGSYHQFIFKDFPKGAHVGNLLHNIFEYINFTETDKTKWEKTIAVSLNQFLPKYKEDEYFKENLLNLIDEVLNTTIQIDGTSFQLSEIENYKKVNELEFDLKTNRFKVEELQSLETDVYKIQTKRNEDIEGVLNGLVDLFFEHNGKYYILDWKSNFLGDTIADYKEENLVKAMNENNYHLQYLIYTLAIKKHLESKLADFDYEKHFGGVIYLFLRGCRKDSLNGVFVNKPNIERIAKLEAIL